MSEQDRILALEAAVLDIHRHLRSIVRTIGNIHSVIQSIERTHEMQHQIEDMRRSIGKASNDE